MTVELLDVHETPQEQLGCHYDEDRNDIHTLDVIIDDGNEPAEENISEKSPDNQNKDPSDKKLIKHVFLYSIQPQYSTQNQNPFAFEAYLASSHHK